MSDSRSGSPHDPSTADMEAYVGRVRGLVVALDGTLDPETLDFANHLIDHGEPPEALVTLAWALDERGESVPRWVVESIFELGEGINDSRHLPSGLRRLATD